MNYKLIKFTKRYFEGFAQLLIDNFEFENKDKRASIYWKFFDPFHNGKTITFLALSNNKVVSQYSNIPYSISFQNNLYRSMLCADMATDSEHRGKKLISKLSTKVYEVVQKQKYDFSIGFSNDDGIKVDKNAKEYGYKIVGPFVRYFKFLILPAHGRYNVIKVRDFDKIWIDTNANFLHVRKDYEFLRWRYSKKPHNTYTIYKLFEDTLHKGYVVVRKGKRAAYIYDIILSDYNKDSIITALKSIESALQKEYKLIIINVMDTHFWKGVFQKAHYLKKKRNNINHHLTVKLHNKELDEKLFLDKENWFLMNGDIL